MFVLIFYVLSPIPTFISRRLSDDDSSSNACRELAYFLTTGIVVSAFGLPIVLARKSAVSFLNRSQENFAYVHIEKLHCCLALFCIHQGDSEILHVMPKRNNVNIFSPTDSVGGLRTGYGRKRGHLSHHLWLFCRVWRRRRF